MKIRENELYSEEKTKINTEQSEMLEGYMTCLFSDLFPDDPGHLVAIQLHNGILHDNLFRHALICDSREEEKESANRR